MRISGAFCPRQNASKSNGSAIATSVLTHSNARARAGGPLGRSGRRKQTA